MAERGARATGEHRRGGALYRGPWWPAHGIDAAVDSMKTAQLDAVGDGVAAQAKRHELLSRDVAVLALRDLGDPGVRPDRHVVQGWKF